MPSIKITVLALATAAAAVPHYAAHGHFHKKGVHGSGGVKPYPTGGWAWNSTVVAPHATGTGSGGDTTIDVTSTSTTTIVKTVVVKPSPKASESVQAAANGAGQGGQCGPATVTVTAKEAVTVTVTPGGGAGAPASSSAVPAASSYGGGYSAPPVVSSSKVEEKPTPTPTPSPVVPSSKVETPTPTPAAPSSSAYVVPVPSPKPSSQPVEASSVAVSSPAPSPSKAPSGGPSYSGSKRGLAYNDAHLCKDFGAKFGFGYNWGQVESNDIGTEFIPMMHRPSESTPEAWLANVDKACSKGTKAVMGFNEPDIAAQANMSPEAACSAWKQYMNPIASSHPDVTIIGPSVSNAGGFQMATANMGLDWLKKFQQVCPDATFHAANIHYYDIWQDGDDGTVSRFTKQIEAAAQLTGKPVWVTEFGLNPGSASSDQAVKFLKAAMAYMDGSDKVQGYSWFMVGTGENQLNTGSGLSPVGQAYAQY